VFLSCEGPHESLKNVGDSYVINLHSHTHTHTNALVGLLENIIHQINAKNMTQIKHTW